MNVVRTLAAVTVAIVMSSSAHAQFSFGSPSTPKSPPPSSGGSGGSTPAQLPQGKMLDSVAPMSAAQATQILANIKPAEKRLTALPAGINPTSLSITATSNQPALATQAKAATMPSATGALNLPAPTAGGISGQITPQNFGAGNINTVYHYTDSLLLGADIDASPSGRAIGFFAHTFDNTNWFWCTATLISNSILVTAGHCVHQGNGSSSGWIVRGIFYPACYNCNTASPIYLYGYAESQWVGTTAGWYWNGSSANGLDNGWDIGVVTLKKRNGTSVEIGAFTGYYAFCYQNCLWSNFYLGARGYPGNYNGGNWMAESQHHVVSDTRDYVFGTGMEGGSSGGPFAANITAMGPVNTSTNQGTYPNPNVIFATRSWGYNDTSVKIGGASSLSGPGNTNNFPTIYNNACNVAKALHGNSSCTLLP